MFLFDFYSHIMGVGAISTSQNHPKCEYICTSDDPACKKGPHKFELSRFYCIKIHLTQTLKSKPCQW